MRAELLEEPEAVAAAWVCDKVMDVGSSQCGCVGLLRFNQRIAGLDAPM